MRVLIFLCVVAGTALVYLMSEAPSNTALFTQNLQLLLYLAGAMALGLMALIVYQLLTLRRKLRERVFGWTKAHFPLTVTGGQVLKLKVRPTVRVVGRAFYDAANAPKGNTESNRRRAVGKDVIAALWEIHPVMNLTVVHQ